MGRKSGDLSYVLGGIREDMGLGECQESGIRRCVWELSRDGLLDRVYWISGSRCYSLSDKVYWSMGLVIVSRD